MGTLTWALLSNDGLIRKAISNAGQLHELADLISTAELHHQSMTRDLGNKLTHMVSEHNVGLRHQIS